jgi:hypothetical protein
MSAGYPKPDGPLLSRPVKRTTPKSAALLAIEQKQREIADAYSLRCGVTPIRKRLRLPALLRRQAE